MINLQLFAVSGRKARAYVALADQENPLTPPAEESFTLVDDLTEVSMSPSADNQDITKLGNDWVNRVSGIRDCSTSMSGYQNHSDLGQKKIWAAFMQDRYIWVRYYIEGTRGFQQCSLVSSPGEPSSSADGVSEASFEMDGHGELHLVGIDLTGVE